MSTSVAVVYPDEATAKAAREQLGALQKEHRIRLADVTPAKNEGDKIKLEQGLNLTGAGAASGALWGGLAELIFLMPVVGMAVGAAAGALRHAERLRDRRQVRQGDGRDGPLRGAALLLIHEVTADKVVAEMSQFGGKLPHTNLTQEQEEKLQAALSGGATA